MRILLSFLSCCAAAQALYFYIDGTSSKCFFEELPKDTLVVGHYKAEEFNDQVQKWEEHSGISIYISVDVSDCRTGTGPSSLSQTLPQHTTAGQRPSGRSNPQTPC